MAKWNVRKAVSGLEKISAPDVGVLRTIEIRTFVRGTLNANRIHICKIDLIADPASEVLVGGFGDVVVQGTIVERSYNSLQAST
jgi:hypothetical protein